MNELNLTTLDKGLEREEEDEDENGNGKLGDSYGWEQGGKWGQVFVIYKGRN